MDIYIFSLMVCGMLAYKFWEAMLISYLTTNIVDLPFSNVETLVQDSSYYLVIPLGTVHLDLFRYSTRPLWMRAFHERIEPYWDDYKSLDRTKQFVKYTLDNEDAAHFNDAFLVM